MFNVLPYDFRYRPGRFALLTSGLLCVVLFGRCDSGTAPSIYDPDRLSLPDPVIDGVMPEGSALAGVDVVTITGTNFSAQPADNLVYFGDARGDVVEASPSQIQVTAPNDPQAELDLRIAVIGAENFSNAVRYGLNPPFVDFGDVRDFEDISGITTDPSGNLYASLTSFGAAVGIIRITPEGERSEFISSPFPWADIEFGPDNSLFGVRSVRAVFSSSGEGSNFQVFAVIPNTTVRLTTMTIDANGRIWAAGDNTEIYSIDSDKTVNAYAFEADIQDIALFQNYLYVAGVQDEASKVWRFSIGPNGDLGAAEEWVDFASLNGSNAYALAFSQSGHLYVGTDNTEPILVIDPDGASEVLYSGVFTQPVRAFAWGLEGLLYATTNSIDSNPAGIIRIVSRRLGYGKFGF